MLQIVTTYFHITSGSVTISLDCLPVMNCAQSTNHLQPDLSSFDLPQDISNWMKDLPLKLKWRHVKSHQDDTIPYNQLDWWVQQNVGTDTQAKDYARLYHSQNCPYSSPQFLLYEKWARRVGGIKQTRFGVDSLYDIVFGSWTRAY